jgi:hypothetical protein
MTVLIDLDGVLRIGGRLAQVRWNLTAISFTFGIIKLITHDYPTSAAIR